MSTRSVVAVHYRNARGDEPCRCCSDAEKKGFGHIFCRAIHDVGDQPVDEHDVLRAAMNAAGVEDGDEFVVEVRKTGRRPFGDQLMLHVRPNGPHSAPVLRRQS